MPSARRPLSRWRGGSLGATRRTKAIAVANLDAVRLERSWSIVVTGSPLRRRASNRQAEGLHDPTAPYHPRDRAVCRASGRRPLFFQLISRRSERGPMSLASNQSFGSLGRCLPRPGDRRRGPPPDPASRDDDQHPGRIPYRRKDKLKPGVVKPTTAGAGAMGRPWTLPARWTRRRAHRHSSHRRCQAGGGRIIDDPRWGIFG